MTRTVLIVGSGPGAAGAALACSRHDDVQVTVLDVGEQLEPDRELVRERMAATGSDEWSRGDIEAVSASPVRTATKGPPQKRAFGSDYPFRDIGQRAGLRAMGGANDAVISSAYGGFSSVWGAQVMPFATATFRTWPVGADEMHKHYRAVLSAIPYAAEEDDLAKHFPLLAPAQHLPRLSERTLSVLERYERHRTGLNKRGVVLGRARLAFDSKDCVLCGLCMTGCPYRLIYSAAQTFDSLRQSAAVDYRSGFLVISVREEANDAVVVAKEIATGAIQEFRADRIFLASGAIGTTRLIAGSLGLLDQDLQMQEAVQFMLPFVSLAPTRTDPRERADFTLNQFNMAIELDGDGFDVSHLHFYTYNPVFFEQLPSPLRKRWGGVMAGHALRRLSIAFGYLPSWASPPLVVRAGAPESEGSPHSLTLSGARVNPWTNATMRAVVGRLVGAAPYVDLWPVLPMLRMSAPAKSYHFGGSFPHSKTWPTNPMSSDLLGRVSPWRRIHAVDGTVVPTIASTTFTLTVMANAHRIADSSLRDLD